jgi:metal-dependent amidase/aminoacylase/carboxypeptidase family protein
MSLKLKLDTFCWAILLLSIMSVSRVNAESQDPHSNKQYIKKLYPELLEIRRDLFDHPEPSGQEKYTSTTVINYLTNLGLEVKVNVGGYGVVGILKGSKPGRRIIWRADMDAAKFEYGEHSHDQASSGNVKHNHVAHVCGHDVHTTIGLGIANTLSQNLESLAGTVYFLFQPAEESQQGAKAMINDGLFDMIQADEIYAAHVGPMPTGVISTSSNNVFAHSRLLKIEFDGADNANAISAMVNQALSSVVRVKFPEKFTDLLNVTDPELGLSNPDTIYKDYVLFGGRPHKNKGEDTIVFSTELIASDYQDIKVVIKKLEQQMSTSQFNDRFRSIQIEHIREGVNNDLALVREANQLFKTTFGEDIIQDNYGKIPFASEDFGHFQKTVPGVYFLIGVANDERDNVAFPHMPGFEVDENVIHHAVSRFSTLIAHRLKY